jgi:hypothetical protein
LNKQECKDETQLLFISVLKVIYVEKLLKPAMYSNRNLKSEYPIVSSLDIGKPICYIQESNGSTLDLSNLCSNRQTKAKLSKLDRENLDNYNNSLEIYQNERSLVSPDTDRAPKSPIAVARGICSALQRKVPLQIKTEQ